MENKKKKTRKQTGAPGSSRRQSDKLLASDWEPEKWRSRCAWCASQIEDVKEAFIIPVSLHEAAFKEFDPDSIQPLYLVSVNRVVPMIVVGKNSPIKQRGKDAYFQVCSQYCGENLKKELKSSLTIAKQP